MMYDFNGNYISVGEVISISKTDSPKPDFPFRLTVSLRNNQQFTVDYKDKMIRDQEAARIAQLHDNTCPAPINRYEMEDLFNKQTNKLLRYIREIKKL